MYGLALIAAFIPTVLGLILIFTYLTPLLFGVNLLFSLSFSTLFFFLTFLTVLVLIDGLIPALKIKQFINVEGLRHE